VHEGGVDLHEFCARTHAGTQMISGLDPADRKQSHVGPAEPAQLFDLLAGLSLPPGILPGPWLCCARPDGNRRSRVDYCRTFLPRGPGASLCGFLAEKRASEIG